MKVIIQNESGSKKERSFQDMSAAAKWCAEFPEFGITIYPEGNEEDWDSQEWQATLEYFA